MASFRKFQCWKMWVEWVRACFRTSSGDGSDVGMGKFPLPAPIALRKLRGSFGSILGKPSSLSSSSESNGSKRGLMGPAMAGSSSASRTTTAAGRRVRHPGSRGWWMRSRTSVPMREIDGGGVVELCLAAGTRHAFGSAGVWPRSNQQDGRQPGILPAGTRPAWLAASLSALHSPHRTRDQDRPKFGPSPRCIDLPVLSPSCLVALPSTSPIAARVIQPDPRPDKGHSVPRPRPAVSFQLRQCPQMTRRRLPCSALEARVVQSGRCRSAPALFAPEPLPRPRHAFVIPVYSLFSAPAIFPLLACYLQLCLSWKPRFNYVAEFPPFPVLNSRCLYGQFDPVAQHVTLH